MGKSLLITARVLFTPVLFVLLCASFASCIAVEIIDRHLLEADFYLEALDENDAYSRVLDEFLMEVEQADTAEDLAAGTEVSREELRDLVGEVVPPEWIQEQFETNLGALLAYLRKDTDELILLLEVGPILDRIQPAVSGFAVERIAEMTIEQVRSFDEFEDRLDTAMDQIAAGDKLVVLPAYEMTEAEVQQAIDAISGLTGLLESSDKEAAVEEALREQDTAGALIAVVDGLIADRVEEATEDLSERLDEQLKLDLIEEISEDEGKSREETLDEFEGARDVVALVTGGGRTLTAILLLLFALLLGALYLPGRRLALTVPGATFIFLGAMGLLWWLVYQSAGPTFIRNRVNNNETDLSESGVELVADVAEALVQKSANAVLVPSVTAFVLGVAAIGLGIYLQARAERPRNSSSTREYASFSSSASR